MEELKDIRDSQVIQNSLMEYMIVFGLVVIAIVILVYFLKRKKKKISKEEHAIKALKGLDFKSETNSKELAYQFTILGNICLQEQYKDEYLNIVNQLETYKYKKEVKTISDDLKSEMAEYIKVRL